jgi:hypothetical protein
VTPVASQNRCFCHALKLLIIGLGQFRRPLSPTLAESWQRRLLRRHEGISQFYTGVEGARPVSAFDKQKSWVLRAFLLKAGRSDGEDWSMETFDVLRRRGAQYLVTPYEFGIKHKPTLFAQLDRRFRTLGRNEKWVFYDLQLPAPNDR